MHPANGHRQHWRLTSQLFLPVIRKKGIAPDIGEMRRGKTGRTIRDRCLEQQTRPAIAHRSRKIEKRQLLGRDAPLGAQGGLLS